MFLTITTAHYSTPSELQSKDDSGGGEDWCLEVMSRIFGGGGKSSMVFVNHTKTDKTAVSLAKCRLAMKTSLLKCFSLKVESKSKQKK